MADNDMWRVPRPIARSIFLRDLREECLKHSEKRMPKWKFRIAPDFIIQLQPKPGFHPTERQIEEGARPEIVRFEGIGLAVATGTANAEMFTKHPSSQTTKWCRYNFRIFAHDSKKWQLKLQTGMWSFDYEAGRLALHERIVATFKSDFFNALTPARLLGNHCFICGKGLTDPGSMARRIGPECAGTSTLVVPFTIEKVA